MTTTNPEPTETLRRRLAAAMAEASKRRQFWTDVHALAGQRLLGAEQDYAITQINEWDAEYDDLITQAADAGFGPEDFDS